MNETPPTPEQIKEIEQIFKKYRKPMGFLVLKSVGAMFLANIVVVFLALFLFDPKDVDSINMFGNFAFVTNGIFIAYSYIGNLKKIREKINAEVEQVLKK